jgi:hypothetical protein
MNVTFHADFPKRQRHAVRLAVQEMAHILLLEHLWECNVRLTRAKHAAAYIKVTPESHYAALYLHAGRLHDATVLQTDIAHELLHIPAHRLVECIRAIQPPRLAAACEHFFEDYHDHVARVLARVVLG